MSRLFSNYTNESGGDNIILQNIEALCKAQGVSIAKLEKAVGIGNGTISRWDKSSPTVENAQKVAAFFGVSLEYLVTAHKCDC